MYTSAPTQPNTNAQVEDSALLLQSEFLAIIREQTGMNESFASPVAAAIVRGLRLRHGTQRLYIPGIDKAERNAAIRREFNGTNAGEVCKRHDISRSRLYEIANEK